MGTDRGVENHVTPLPIDGAHNPGELSPPFRRDLQANTGRQAPQTEGEAEKQRETEIALG